LVEVNKSDNGNTAANHKVVAPSVHQIELPSALNVRQLANSLNTSAVEIIKQLMRQGIMANINQVISYDTAAAVAKAMGYESLQQPLAVPTAVASSKSSDEAEKPDDNPHRPPVVTIMGHVDHGKTRLLDAIRETNVMDAEAGGITQHIGAYQVEVSGQKITFLDTPGHEAFTAMRARGAQVTDITILVVAADDGVMPQTLEAIDHARAAGVPIVVAINKVDRPGANIDRVKQQLADAGLATEDWGGDTISVATSAKEGTGIADLLENLLLVAELEDLRANPSQPAEGVVIEAELDKTKGPMATVLVQNGTLNLGDTVVAGSAWGRVKAMFNDGRKRVKKAEPATPVAILGLDRIPQVGDSLKVVADEHEAKDIATEQWKPRVVVSLSNLRDEISAGHITELNVIMKADVQGSIEPIRDSLERLGSDELKVRIIHGGTGNITESDVLLAAASKGLIIGFNTGIEGGALRSAEFTGVDIRRYSVIYKLVEDLDKALKGLLAPTFVDIIIGLAEIKAVFSAGKHAKVAGVMVKEGRVMRDNLARVKRRGETIFESKVGSLRRFKDDVKEVAAGYECGIGLKDFNDFEVGDIIELYREEKAS
jgi:translation initiation factor IF-2